MRIKLRQAEELGDDIVIEPHYQLGWRMQLLGSRRAGGNSLGRLPAEVDRLQFQFPDRDAGGCPQAEEADVCCRSRGKPAAQETCWKKRSATSCPSGSATTIPSSYEFDVGQYGDLGFTGNYFFGLTWQVYRFIGNQGLLYWVYDAPDAIHRLMSYMLDDRLALFDYFEREGLLAANTDNQMAGPRMYGYVSDLPEPNGPGSRSS